MSPDFIKRCKPILRRIWWSGIEIGMEAGGKSNFSIDDTPAAKAGIKAGTHSKNW